ncbi:hypothetical protein PVAP13_5NG106762 [Panicum virgatum]|uniref:Uncharacterized protein n=1 Tax=Panicum virgatum TaxID=38727 RepID=A0A8T0RPT2_PANVG|nr:hypothetical protein PVAP13_5NG106762 [Panicum virgatum]
MRRPATAAGSCRRPSGGNEGEKGGVGGRELGGSVHGEEVAVLISIRMNQCFYRGAAMGRRWSQGAPCGAEEEMAGRRSWEGLQGSGPVAALGHGLEAAGGAGEEEEAMGGRQDNKERERRKGKMEKEKK